MGREPHSDEDPFSAGKFGVNEARAVLWGTGLRISLPLVGSWRTKFWETRGLDTNAGIKPREPGSCRRYSEAMVRAAQNIDVLGVFKHQTEYVLCQRFTPAAGYCEVEHLSPTLAENPWSAALQGKTVFVVSPFLESFRRQQPKMGEVWKSKAVMPEFRLIGYRFPYLIENDSRLSWWDVFEEIKVAMRQESFDVALFGCGGLGLPLAAYAKEQGRIGIHLGGALQMLFGVYGGRHLEQDWHRQCINDAWVRPAPDEVPKCASRVENACYW